LARLIHPTAGTVVTVEGNLEDRYRAAGWSEEGQQEEATSEKPKTRRSRKTSTE